MASESEISLIHKFQLGLKNPGGAYIVDRDGQMYVGKKDADIAVADAWRLDSSLGISLGRRNVVVAVIDDGFDLTSPEVSRNLYTNMGEGAANRCNNKDDDGNGFIDDYQGWDAVAEHGCYDSGALIENIDVPGAKGHGSHVASIIAGGRDKTNPTSAAGVAPFVSILPIKAFSPESGGYQTANLIKAYNYVLALKKRGVNIAVVNTSYAGPCSDLGDGEVQALVALVQAGITVVGAAGNVSGSLPTDNDSIPHCPGNLGATRGAELGVQGIVSVAMSAPGPRSGNNLITLHPWSRQGARTVNVAAPGTSIYANGEFRSGTSMATPHVSGIVALMYSVNPFITPAEVERILSDPSNSMNYGFPVVSKGIVSAQKAVQAAAAKIVSGVVSFNGRPYRAAEVIMVQGRDVLRSRTDSSGYFFFPLSSTALPVTIDVKAEGLYAPSQTKVGSPAPRFSFGLEQVLKPGPGKSMVK